MIGRIWHGETATADADRYLDFLKQRAIPDYRSVAGNVGVYLMRRIDGDCAHFITLSLWDSLQSIEAFAGKDIERAKYYPEDKEFLLAFELTVQHWEMTAAVSK
jgi:heme-degrading monooxygenase HmoA